jgi:hypothetical protein
MRPGIVPLLCLLPALVAKPAEPLRRLKVSENHHFLVTDPGQPFFWLVDTAWELFHRCDREDAERYLDDRARKGFNVIQAVVLAECANTGTREFNPPNPGEALDWVLVLDDAARGFPKPGAWR